MPRGPRLDAPGALHHVIARGIERGSIFRDDEDREGFLARLGTLAAARAISVYAWALMPNHFHVLCRTREWPLARAMRSLLSGYATWHNLRHERVGHLFQNRYRSILCEDEPYFLALVRYIHRNPVPSIVPRTAELDRYPYTGHSAIVGGWPRDWQDTDEVLARFSGSRAVAVRCYGEFIRRDGPERNLEGGGLRRSRSFWSELERVEAGRERFGADERILGSRRFVESVRRSLPRASRAPVDLVVVISRVCSLVGIEPSAIQGNGRSREICRAREGIAFLWTIALGNSRRSLARTMGVAESSLQKAAKRGAADSGRWLELIRESSEPAGFEGNRTPETT